MSINKSQGQSLEFISVWLGKDDVFSHGQLYVCLSRVSSMNNIIICLDGNRTITRNVVYTEIFE